MIEEDKNLNETNNKKLNKKLKFKTKFALDVVNNAATVDEIGLRCEGYLPLVCQHGHR